MQVFLPEGDPLETPEFFCSGLILVKIQQTKLLILVSVFLELSHRERVSNLHLTVYMTPGTQEVSLFIMNGYAYPSLSI